MCKCGPFRYEVATRYSTYLIEYDPELGSCLTLKLSRLSPKPPKMLFPRSFNLPASQIHIQPPLWVDLNCQVEMGSISKNTYQASPP